jgi:hypothetical protein
MFQLYKKRGFSDYLNDTFGFLKLSGRHFFKNYAIICGGILLIITALGYVVFKANFEFFKAAMDGIGSNSKIFGENLFLFGILLILFLIIFILVSVICYLFPIVYLRLYEEKGDFSFTTNEILVLLKANIWRAIKFVLWTILFYISLGIFVIALLGLICITIIGIPFAVIGLFALIGILNISFFLYVNNHNVGYIDSFKIAFQFVKNNLWPAVGANFAILVLVWIVGSVTSMIPMVIGMVGYGSGLGTVPGAEESAALLVIMGISYAISFLVQFVLNNLIILTNGMIYYTMQEANHSHFSKSEIDLIGTESEF